MYLEFVYDARLSQVSYFIGCPDTKEALVVDPRRNIQPYLRIAEKEEYTITRVAETHIHADFVSGGHELAVRTGANYYVSGEGRGELAYDFSEHRDLSKIVYLKNNAEFVVGNINLRAIHTPGHTPEHLCFLLTDGGVDDPMALLSGDCLFVNDVGRPDLLDATGAEIEGKEAHARDLFHSLQKLRKLPDYLLVLPGHRAGSACGKDLGQIPASSMGYEKRQNPAFQHKDADAFAAWLLDGQPEVPHYFAQMKRVNRTGAPLTGALPEVEHLDVSSMYDVTRQGFVIDTRREVDFARGHLPGTVNIPLNFDEFSTWAGWFIDYERPTYFIANRDRYEEALQALRGIGVDKLRGWLPSELLNGADQHVNEIDPEMVAARDDAYILDVRSVAERREQYIPGSEFIPMGYVPQQLERLPRDKQIVVQCGAGIRSQIVTSILHNHGFDAVNLSGGIDAWEEAGLPLEQGD